MIPSEPHMVLTPSSQVNSSFFADPSVAPGDQDSLSLEPGFAAT